MINKKLRCLIGCEFSGVMREEFRKLGWDAWSCDLEPTEIEGQHIQGDVLEVLDYGWDLAIFHPDCFSADTLVLTKNGYKEISKILVGEEVLTHKQRWKKVTKTISYYSDSTLDVFITGSSKITTTNNHPFYSKNRTWKRERISKDKIVNNKYESQPDWVIAENLVSGSLIGGILPPIDCNTLDISDEHLWLMGLYVADGHLRLRNNRYDGVFFSIGKEKANYLKNNLQRKFSTEIKGSVTQFNMYGHDFCKSFVQFGRGAENKQLPGWVLSLPRDKAAIFLDGYLFGDGYKDKKVTKSSSISKKLTLGIALLMRRVFNKPSSVYENKRNSTTIIEGRLVNQKTSWVAQVQPNAKRTISTIDGDVTWNCFRKSIPNSGMMVYNLSVDEDESYVVDQCIVHNCTYLTVTGNKWFKPEYKDRFPTREQDRKDAIEFFMKLANAPISRICIENPVGVMSTVWRKPNCIIQPFEHGHPEPKKTCLWMIGDLPKTIKPTNIVEPEYVMTKSGKRVGAWYFNPSRSPERQKARNRTFSGVAAAIANQFTEHINESLHIL